MKNKIHEQIAKEAREIKEDLFTIMYIGLERWEKLSLRSLKAIHKKINKIKEKLR